MLKTFIYNEEKREWIEEDAILLFQDICVILDTDSNQIFLWKGPKAKKSLLKKGKQDLLDLISNMPGLKLNLNNLEEKLPERIQNKIDSMLNAVQVKRKSDSLKYSHFFTIRLSLLLMVIVILSSIAALFVNISSIFWQVSSTNFQISSSRYILWLDLYKTFLILVLIMISINLLVSLYEKDIGLIIICVIGIVILIGILMYASQGIFLFIFQAGSTDMVFLINISDIYLYVFLNIIALTPILLLHLLKCLKFLKSYWRYIIP
ncbi:MAG: hypothetical protein GF317_21905 [Candidatus Lokiarchaeota archaeon]|nr:hypothetical protein [Candidatus Lokiarchaeota archaeon]MBD3202114.1 hypothetical protein [Candidatus Lokiarchaeota archaeon]